MTTTQSTQKTTLILGGTGKTGRRVAERLEARGLPVRIGSRSGSPPFDWNDESTWEPVMRGVDAIYLTYFPDLAVPGAAAQVRGVTKAAVKAGVTRIVIMGGRGEPQAHESEQAVRDSGAAYTILRCAWFNQNFTEGHATLQGSELPFPGGNTAEPFIDCDDIADVAVVALTEDGHNGQTYDLTGPRLLTFADVAADISEAAGRPIKYVPVTSEQYAEMLRPYLPPDVVSFFVELFAFLLDGHNANLTHDVERILGRKPRDFRDFARAAAASGAWK